MTEHALPPVPAIAADTLAALEARHVAFLEQRLVSDAARADWVRSFRAGYAWALGLRVGDVVHPRALTDGLSRALTEASVKEVVAPVMREIHRRVLATLRAEDSRLADYVDAEARLAIDALLERSDLVPERLVRELFEQEAVEDALRDIFFDGMVEFNQTVNPFFADWGLPALLKKMPIGGGTILKSMGAMRGEFDRRLEPEIRKFLQVFARKATVKLADFTITRGGDPKTIALRKNVVSLLYTQTIAELLHGVDDAAAAHGDRAAEAILLQLLRRERPRDRLREALELLLQEHGAKTIGEWLDDVGVTGEPALDEWADLLWPHVQRAFGSPVARDFFRALAAEFYASLPRAPS